MVAIDPARCREILTELDRLAILELEAMARRMMEADGPILPSQNRET
jgi:hypothetical protein